MGYEDLDIHDFMNNLGKERPLFHSEADFQHTLAWELHQKFPSSKVRLEYPIKPENEKWIYVDIWSEINGGYIAIELKYKTVRLDTTYKGEPYHLKQQGAQPQGRYDFLKDVQRLEKITTQYPVTRGYAIFLTNDAGYWRGKDSHTVDRDFRIHQGRTISNSLHWQENTSLGTQKGRTSKLSFSNEYNLEWRSYSTIRGDFRYCALGVVSG